MPDNPFNQHFEQEINRRNQQHEQKVLDAEWKETASTRTKAAKGRYTRLVENVLYSLQEAYYPHNHVVKTTHDFENPGEAPHSAITYHAFDWAIIIPDFIYYNLMEDTFFSKADLKKSQVNLRYASSHYMQPRDRVVVGVNLNFNAQRFPQKFQCYRSNREEETVDRTSPSLVDALIKLHTPTPRTKLVWQYDSLISRALMGLWTRVGLDQRGRIAHPQVIDAMGEVFTRSTQRLGTWKLELAKPGGVGLYEYESFAEVDIHLDADQTPRNFVIDPGGKASPLNFPDLLKALQTLAR